MMLRRVAAVLLRHAYETRHNLDRLTDAIYWPVLDVIMWVFFTSYLRQGDRLHASATNILLGGLILWGLFRSFQRDLAVGFLAEIWSRNIVNLFASPLTVTEYIVGLVVVNFIKAAIGMLCAIGVARLGWSGSLLNALPSMLPFIAILVLFALAVGVAVTGLIFRYTTRVQTLAYGIAGLLMPLSCVFYPVAALPGMLRPLALALPTTHAFEGMRQILSGGGVSMLHLWSGLGLTGIYFTLAVKSFRTVYEAARRRGHLVKLD